MCGGGEFYARGDPRCSLEASISEADTRYEDALSDARRDGVIWLAYGNAGRHLIRLAAPAVLVFLPVNLLALLGLALVVDDSAALVNGSFELLGTPGRPLLVWAASAILITLAGQLVVIPATVVIAVRLLAGRPAALSGAMRAALRKLPEILGLALLGVVVVMAAGFGMLWWTEQWVPALFAVVLLVVLAMPCLLAVPIVLVEGRTPVRAVMRAYGLVRGDGLAAPGFWSCTLTLNFGVLVFPAAAQAAVQWATSGNLVLSGAATSVLGMVVPAFQATVIARLYLSRVAHRDTAAEFEQAVESLSGTASRARPVLVLTGLLLPGLLYGGVVLVNPFAWLEVDQLAVTATWSQSTGLDGGELRAIYTDPGGRLTVFLDGPRLAKLLTCTNDDCPPAGYRQAEPDDADRGSTAVSAQLYDGRIALTTRSREGEGDDRRVRLGLMVCDSARCTPASGPVGKSMPDDDGGNIALASAYEGLMIAQVRNLRESRDENGREVLSVTICEDPACTDPRTRELARLPSRTTGYWEDSLAVAAGPWLNPVVLRLDGYDGSLFLITCEEAGCAEVSVERLARHGQTSPLRNTGGKAGAAMLVRADGRPLIAYSDSADGSIRMLDCRDLNCSRYDSALVAEPGGYRFPPALAVDEAGRALVAHQDVDSGRIVVAVCTGARCEITPVAKSQYVLGAPIAMTLDAQGRPVIGWVNRSENGWDLFVTTLLNHPAP